MMKNNREKLIALLTIVLVILLTACHNSSDASSGVLDKKPQNNNSSQNSIGNSSDQDATDDASNTDNTDTDTNDIDDNNANKKMNTSNNEPEEDESSAGATASLKEEYLRKLNDAKNKVEKMRQNPIDDTTFALKKVEGDAYDILDGLLNEIYEVLKTQLPTEEMDQLRKEQREWIDYRDHTAKEASLKYKGGTMEQYEYVRVENDLTEERCYELVEEYMK